MSAISLCYDSSVNKFIQTFPKMSRASLTVSKVCFIAGAVGMFLGLFFIGTMIATNPNLYYLSQYSVSQIGFLATSFGTGIVSFLTGIFLESVSRKIPHQEHLAV